VAPRYRSLQCKIGTHPNTVNGHEVHTMLTLLIALISLVTWAVLAFGMGPQPGVVHLLLGLGTTLLVRWWALRT
jgi:hypothetical protein